MCRRGQRGVVVIAFVLGLGFTFAVTAQGEVKREEVEIDGLIIDQTQTRIGREFYQQFVTFWEAPEGIADYNIFIVEKATPQWGSVVWIKVNDVMVYRNVLRPRTEGIKEAVRKCAEITREYLYRHSEQKRKLEGEDMAGDGM